MMAALGGLVGVGCLPDRRRTVRPPGVRRRSHRSCRALGGQPRPRSGRRSRRRRRWCPCADRMAGRSVCWRRRGSSPVPACSAAEQPRGIHRPHRGHRRVDRDGPRLHRRRLGPRGGDPGHGHRGASAPSAPRSPLWSAASNTRACPMRWPPSGTTCPTRPPTSSSPLWSSRRGWRPATDRPALPAGRGHPWRGPHAHPGRGRAHPGADRHQGDRRRGRRHHRPAHGAEPVVPGRLRLAGRPDRPRSSSAPSSPPADGCSSTCPSSTCPSGSRPDPPPTEG